MPSEAVRNGSLKAVNILAAVAVVFLVAGTLYWARVIFIPIALAIYFTFILTPLVIYLQRRRLPRVLAVIVVLATSLFAFAVVALVVGRQMVQLATTLPEHADKIKEKMELLKNWVGATEGSRVSDLLNDVSSTLADRPKKTEAVPTTTVTPEAEPDWVARAKGVLSPAAEALGQVAFTFILLAFMLNRREDLRNRLFRLLGHGQLTTTTKAVDDMSRRVSRYLLVQFLLNASFGVVIVGGLLIMRVPYAPLWGFLAFLMRYVPYVGSWIAVVPPTLFSMTMADTWTQPLLVFVLFIGLELLVGNVFEPLLYGRSLGLSEVAQLVSAAFWALMWGPVGLILSGPLTVGLLVLGKYVPQWQFLNVILGDEPVLPPYIAFYQRLAARDADEAAQIVEKELDTRPAEKVFDDVLVPALSRGRHDLSEGSLSENDLQFVYKSIREIADTVVEFKPLEEAADGSPIRVLIVPAKDAVDHTATELFSRLLNPALWEAQVTVPTALTSELIELIEKWNPSALVIGALPPGGLTHGRFLTKRIRHRFPDLKVVVGRWGASEEDPTNWAPLRAAGADEVTRSFEDTRVFLLGWRAVLAATPTTPAKLTELRRNESKLIGTATA